MNVVVIDAQGGKIGKQLVSGIRKALPELEIMAVGANGTATAAMLSGGAARGATGENAVIVACRSADVILGPIGIAIADSLMGEISPAMAKAVGQSPAKRILIPFDHCNNVIAGAAGLPVSKRILLAIEALKQIVDAQSANSDDFAVNRRS